MAKKRYTVEVYFNGRYQTEVTADSQEQAQELAENQLQQDCQWCTGVESIDVLLDEDCDDEHKDDTW